MYKIQQLLLLFMLYISLSLQKPASPSGLKEDFHEELYVRPLSSGHINTYFQFTTRWHYGNRNNLHNTHLIPRPIADILLQYDINELHISLTHGLWRYEPWGYPVVDAAPGAEVWAWFVAPNLTSTDVTKQWTNLASTFSGILCASLNFIDRTNSVEPKYSLPPQFVIKKSRNLPRFVRYATLPREIVCTENLTPWKKLLPCNSKEGFASLLNSAQVYNTNYHSMAIKMRTICESYEQNCILEFTETVNLVYDRKVLGSRDFSLRRLFGQGLNGHCTLATTSKIYVDTTNSPFDISPVPDYNLTSKRGGATTYFSVYDIQNLKDNGLFNIVWTAHKEKGISITPLPPISAHRYILGRGQKNGQIVTQITNSHYGSLRIIFKENIPWFVPSYMHTLKVVVMSGAQKNFEIEPKTFHYIPGLQRERAYHLEIAFEIPAKSTIKISFDFDYIFLKWLEYPPDANHGHYIGSALITTQLPIGKNYSAIPIEGYLFADSFNASRSNYFLQIYTEALLLSLPTPDFSMPYNVICLACTVVALAFGPIHSVATKRIIIQETTKSKTSIFTKMINKLKWKKNIEASIETLEEDASRNSDQLSSDDSPETLIGFHEKSE